MCPFPLLEILIQIRAISQFQITPCLVKADRSESNETIARKNVKEDLNDKDSCLLSYV
jgi:hypothetical protein